jgi:hypothetical protein
LSGIFDSKFIDWSEGPLFDLRYSLIICRGMQGKMREQTAVQQRGQTDDVPF